MLCWLLFCSCLLRCSKVGAWCFFFESCRLTVVWVDCRCSSFLGFPWRCQALAALSAGERRVIQTKPPTTQPCSCSRQTANCNKKTETYTPVACRCCGLGPVHSAVEIALPPRLGSSIFSSRERGRSTCAGWGHGFSVACTVS